MTLLLHVLQARHAALCPLCGLSGRPGAPEDGHRPVIGHPEARGAGALPPRDGAHPGRDGAPSGSPELALPG